MIPTKAATQGIEAYSMGRARTFAYIDDQPLLGGAEEMKVAVCLLVIMGVRLDSGVLLPILTIKVVVAVVGPGRDGIVHEALFMAAIMVAIWDWW